MNRRFKSYCGNYHDNPSLHGLRDFFINSSQHEHRSSDHNFVILHLLFLILNSELSASQLNNINDVDS